MPFPQLDSSSSLPSSSGGRYGILSIVHLECKAKDCVVECSDILKQFLVSSVKIEEEEEEDGEDLHHTENGMTTMHKIKYIF